MPNTYIISDTHWNAKPTSAIIQKCLRPENFTELSLKRWNQTVRPEDTVIHLGDVVNGPKREAKAILDSLNGRKIHVRGNHDREKSCKWWMENGFDVSVDFFVQNGVLFTHEPANAIYSGQGKPYDSLLDETLPLDCHTNVHGHLHNIWDGFIDPERYQRDKALLGIDFLKQLRYPWQRLFAFEYTNYFPVSLEKFLAHPEKYQADGPRKKDA